MSTGQPKGSAQNDSIAFLVDVDSLLKTDSEPLEHRKIIIRPSDPKREQQIKAIKTRLHTHGVLNMAFIDVLLTIKINTIHLLTTQLPSADLSYLDILAEVLQEKGLTVTKVWHPTEPANTSENLKGKIATQFDEIWNAPAGKCIVFGGSNAPNNYFNDNICKHKTITALFTKDTYYSCDGSDTSNDSFLFYFQSLNKQISTIKTDSSTFNQPRTNFPINTANVAGLEDTINHVYTELLRITARYTERNSNPAKRKIFTHFYSILLSAGKETTEITQEKKVQAILNFKNLLDAKNKDITLHRTPSWLRYIYDAFSILTLLPICSRALYSRSTYGTWAFWKPTSEKALLNIRNDVDIICDSVRSPH